MLRRFSFRSLMSTCIRIVTSAWLFNPDQCGSTVALLWLYREINSDILDCLPQMIISTTTVCSKKTYGQVQIKVSSDCLIYRRMPNLSSAFDASPEGAMGSSPAPFLHAKNKTKQNLYVFLM